MGQPKSQLEVDKEKDKEKVVWAMRTGCVKETCAGEITPRTP